MVKFICAKEARKSTCDVLNGVKDIGKSFGEKNIIIYLSFVLNARMNPRWNTLLNLKKGTSE